VARVRAAEADAHAAWTQCQRCQGSVLAADACGNRDCPLFYARTVALDTVVQAASELARLETYADW
jgi:DNA polymerase delta subunit 1